MRLAIFLCVGAFSALPCHAQPLEPAAPASRRPLTERDALTRFMTTDPRIRALTARIEEIQATQAERLLWPNPSVTFSRESVLGAHDTFLLARQEVPISGRRGRLRAAGRLAVEAAEADMRFERVQLQIAVREAYVELLLAQQRHATIEESIAALEQLVARLRLREDQGEGSTYDRMRGQRALVDLEADRSAAAADRARAQGRLAGYLGPDARAEALVASESLLPGSSPVPLAPAVLEHALRDRGDYVAAELAIARFDEERLAATRLRIPTPSLSGGLKRSDVGGTASDGYQIALDLAIPLFSRGQAATAVATAQQRRAQADAASRRLQIETEVRTAYSVARIHHEHVRRYHESTAAIAEPLVTIARVGYEEGELGILELLDAERQVLDARVRLLELAATARRGALELDRVLGVEFRP